jgi:hypothetical protein
MPAQRSGLGRTHRRAQWAAGKRGRGAGRGIPAYKSCTVGSFEHTPQHLYDVDDPCFVFVESSWSCSGGGDWGDYDHSMVYGSS